MGTIDLSYWQAYLTQIDAAISKILEGGQDLSISDKRIIYGRLGNLFDEKAKITKIIQSLEGSGSPLARNYAIRKRL